jgi:hypothetical protein
MALPTLPVEILQRIIEASIPEGFEALALSCQRLYAASKRYVPDYARLKARYRRISYSHPFTDPEDDEECMANPLSHLLEFAEEPVATRFVEEADFQLPWFRGMGSDLYQEAQPEFIRSFNDAIEKGGSLYHLLQLSLTNNDFFALYETTASSYLNPFLGTDSAARLKNFQPPDGSLPDLMDLEERIGALHERIEALQERINVESFLSGHTFSLKSKIRDVIESEDYAITCILTLLPNVRNLSLEWNYDWGVDQSSIYEHQPERMWAFLSAIASNANNPKKPWAGLSRLTTLSLMKGGGCNVEIPIQQYLPLFTIESLQTIRCESLILSAEETWPNCPRISMFAKNLETVELSACSIGNNQDWKKNLTALLSRMPNLKSFKLCHEEKSSYDGWFPAQLVVDEISEHLDGSLEDLSLSVRMSSENDTSLSILHGIRSMKLFKRLSAVELDIRLFIGLYDSLQPENSVTPTPLVSILPASINTAILLLSSPNYETQWETCPKTEETLKGLGHNFKSEWKTKLPNLRLITFRGRLSGKLETELSETFEPVVVRFENDKATASHMRHVFPT